MLKSLDFNQGGWVGVPRLTRAFRFHEQTLDFGSARLDIAFALIASGGALGNGRIPPTFSPPKTK